MPMLLRQLMCRVRLALLAAVASLGGAAGAEEQNLQVFAAASLQEVLEAASAQYTARAGEDVVLVYAGSGAMARQIAAGAPADLFISANAGWADWLAEAVPSAQRAGPVAGNELVVVVPQGQAQRFGSTLEPALFGARVAMGLTEAVPAGIYGRQALETFGLWSSVAPRVVETENVRAALALVAAGAVSSGIVYRSDAQAEPRVRAVARFPSASHDPIRYPVLKLSDAATPFLELLLSAEGQALFADHGFTPLSELGQ